MARKRKTKQENEWKTLRNIQRKKGALCIVIGLILLVIFGQFLSFQLQENSYGRFNILQPISKALGYPMYLTTFFYLLGGCFGFVGGMVLFWETDGKEIHLLNQIVGWTAVVFNVIQEVGQVIKNPYPDHHVMDIIMGILAVKLFWLLITFIFPPPPP